VDRSVASIEEKRKRLQRIFDGIKSITSKEDLLQQLRRLVLAHVARKEGYIYFSPFFLRIFFSFFRKKVEFHSLLIFFYLYYRCGAIFLGDSATKIAMTTISGTSKGRGFSLPLETAFEDIYSFSGNNIVTIINSFLLFLYLSLSVFLNQNLIFFSSLKEW